MAEWVDASGSYVPDGAFHAGDDHGGPLYICRAEHEGDLIPGKVVSGIGAFVSHGGSEHQKSQYQVLVASPGRTFFWHSTDAFTTPIAGSIAAGNTATGEALYIARVKINRVDSCGKFHPSFQKAYIPYDHLEHTFDIFEILVLN